MSKKQEPNHPPAITYCKHCQNSEKIVNYMSWCNVFKIWQHSPVRCKHYKQKDNTKC